MLLPDLHQPPEAAFRVRVLPLPHQLLTVVSAADRRAVAVAAVVHN
jgi:hypothetical protein